MFNNLMFNVMAEEKTYVFGNDGQSGLWASLPALLSNRGVDPSILAAFGNRGFCGNDGDILALIILFAIFGGGFGNFGFGGNGRTYDANTDMIMQTLNRNGLDIGTLATNLNITKDAVTSAISGVATQLSQCCCENKTAVMQQGYESRIQNAEQTAILGGKIDAQTAVINDKFCQLEMRGMQDKLDALREKNTSLINQLSNEHQTAAIQSYVAQVVSPIASDVAALKASAPPTVSVPYPQLAAVPASLATAYYSPFGVNTGSIWS